MHDRFVSSFKLICQENMYMEADIDEEHGSFSLAVRVHEDMVLFKDGLPIL